jgi:molecular chaperone GrpE
LNYKKEEMERIKGFMVYAGIELVLKILPILDNFDVTEKKLPDNLKNDENVKGLLQIRNQLLDFLKSQGVEEIRSVGEVFDPNFHEIIGEVSPSEALAKEGKAPDSGIIIEEIQKGYKINGELLRPAKVRITK